MDVEILVGSMLRAHGFPAGGKVLSVRPGRVTAIDFHPPDCLLYAELDLERRYAYNLNLYVDPRSRHKGLGARLLALHEEICREAGLTILINNDRNPGFWKRQGYRRLNPFRQLLLSRRLGLDFHGQSLYKRTR